MESRQKEKETLALKDGPLVLKIDGVVLATCSSEQTSIVLNELGRLTLKKLLAKMSRDDYRARGLTNREAAWLDYLWEVL